MGKLRKLTLFGKIGWMAEPNKYEAVWVSHSSIGDFLACPRLYYLRAIYKDPVTGHKITLMQPPLALGQIVHEVVESLSLLPVEERFDKSLLDKFELAWKKVEGRKGGFTSKEEEEKQKDRGRSMLSRIMKNPGPVGRKAIKIKQDLPHYWLSEEEGIILCGKVDWLEYLEKTDGVHVVDFKTGKWEEKETSLQLPIYHLLVTNTQKRKVEKTSYWYLDKNDEPTKQELPDLKKAHEDIMMVAKRMKLARSLEHFKCPSGGCRHCLPMEELLRGKGERVGISEYNQDIYVLV